MVKYMAPFAKRPSLASCTVPLCCLPTTSARDRGRPRQLHTRSRVGRRNLRDRKRQAHSPNTGYQPAPHSRRSPAGVERVRVGSHDGAVKTRDRQRKAERGPQSELALEDLMLSTGARVVRPDAPLDNSRSRTTRGSMCALTGL